LELHIFAVIAVVLQASVLIFTGFITYHPNLRYKKGDRVIPPYAYPLSAIGTLVLVTGMLICSFIVERSTKEELWTINKSTVANMETDIISEFTSIVAEELRLHDENELVRRGIRRTIAHEFINSNVHDEENVVQRIVKDLIELERLTIGPERRVGVFWLQQGANVNDQVFDSCAIFAQGSRESLLTSRLAINASATSEDAAIALPVESNFNLYRKLCRFCKSDESYMPTESKSSQILVVVGTLISVCGFIVQL